MAKARVIVEKVGDKYFVSTKVAYTPEQEQKLDSFSDGKQVVISLTGEGECSPVATDFLDVLYQEAEMKAKELGADRLHWNYGNTPKP